MPLEPEKIGLLTRMQNYTTGTFSFQQTAAFASAEAFVQQLLTTPRYADPRRLHHYEQPVFSQNGEDGILSEIFRRIGTPGNFFVEVGVEDGVETNTTYRLLLGWKGVWIDADKSGIARARERFHDAVGDGRLRIINSFVTAENAAEMLTEANVPREFDLLSLDIDRNTYYVWEALAGYSPRVVVMEYNASIPPVDDWKVPYDAERTWNETVFFGASLKSLERLGTKLGYSLVGCDLSGTNAFFVRSDLNLEHFAGPFTAENHHEPPRYWLRWRAGHRRGTE
jgi:hypothetical protein